MYLVEVAPFTKIPHQKPQVLSYFSAHKIPLGALILAPLGRRLEKAVVIETHQIKKHKLEIKKAAYELRPIKKIISPASLLTNQQIKLALWLGRYYFASPGLFLKMMLPKKIRNQKSQKQSKLAPEQIGIFNRAAGSANQTDQNKFKIFTPSEDKRQNSKSQILILVPEVSQIEIIQKKYSDNKVSIVHSGLKPKQFNENWQKIASGEAEIIIGTRMAVFAPFVNLKQIIIEDETNPHHRSWDMFPHYRVHEAAAKLAELFGAALKFKSNLPSIESCYLTSAKLIRPIHPIRPISSISKIKTEIIDLRQELREGNYSIFSRRLQELINGALEKKEQIILFISRRGAATFILCRDCGYAAKCQNCDAPLTYHLAHYRISDDRQICDKSITAENQLKPILICHHCGQKQNPPPLCPQCQSHRIKAFGTGTQRVELEAKKLFKEARIIRLDSDVAQTPLQQSQILQEFKEKRADILIGTQMILGADLPKVTLVAVMSADTLMHLPDFRSDERLFQTITQLKNFLQSAYFKKNSLHPSPINKKRAERVFKLYFIIQTYNPESTALQYAAADNWNAFFKQEITTRKILKYPPFSQLIKLTFRHKDPKKAAIQTRILFAKLTQQLNINKLSKEVILELLGPAPAFIPKKKQKYIWQIIIKAKPVWLAKKTERQELIRQRNQFLMIVPPDWEIDIDPETLL